MQSNNQQPQQAQDSLTSFIKRVYANYPQITSYKTLQEFIEQVFERDFAPERDQIDYMRKQQ